MPLCREFSIDRSSHPYSRRSQSTNPKLDVVVGSRPLSGGRWEDPSEVAGVRTSGQLEKCTGSLTCGRSSGREGLMAVAWITGCDVAVVE